MKIAKSKTKFGINNLNYSLVSKKKDFSSHEVEQVINYLKSNLDSSTSNKITLFLSSDTKKEFNEGVEISSTLLEMALQVMQELTDEKKIIVVAEDEELTTQQAADYLNISRPYLIKLVEEDKIPFRKVGTHRRIKLKEIIKYDNLLRKEQKMGLEELTKKAQELNLGYE